MTEHQDSIKRFVLGRSARIYRAATIDGKIPCKLVINGVLEDEPDGATVYVEVVDQSRRSRYGTELIYEPVAIHDPEDAAAAMAAVQRRAEATRWLGYAESDAASGLDHTRAITEAIRLSAGIAGLTDRRAVLLQRVAANQRAAAERQATRERQWTAERAARQAQRQTEQAARDKARALRTLVWVDNAPALNVPTRLHRGADAPVVVYTGLGKSWWMSEEESDTGIMGDLGEGHVCYAYYRMATADEIAACAAREDAERRQREDRRDRQARYAAARARIQAEGERPVVAATGGERLLGEPTIYGGGEWFVIADDAIWFVQGNGGDGDNWGATNIGTPGYAGDSGWRVPFDPALAAELRALQAAIDAETAAFRAAEAAEHERIMAPFWAEWTPAVTAERRERWNAAIREVQAAGRSLSAADLGRLQQRMGFTHHDLVRAVERHVPEAA